MKFSIIFEFEFIYNQHKKWNLIIYVIYYINIFKNYNNPNRDY